MNRRSFLKRVAIIAAGAAVVPTICKSSTYKLPRYKGIGTRYRWCFSRIRYPFNFKPPSEPSWYPDYKVGTLYKAPDGSIYKYIKHRGTKTLAEGRYARYPESNLLLMRFQGHKIYYKEELPK